MSEQGLSRVFAELLRHLGGSRTQVFLRTYQLSGGVPEAGEPPSGSYEDTELLPRPIVMDVAGKDGVGLREVVSGNRQATGLKRLVIHGDCWVVIGSRLYFDGAEWEVIQLCEPVLFQVTPLKLVLARRLLQ